MFQPVIKFLVPSFQDFLGPSLFTYEYSNFFQTNYFTKQLQTTDCKGFFCLFRMTNDCCFRWAAQGQLPQCNRRNIVTVLRTVVKSHKGLKGTKVFACGCFGRNIKKKLRPVIAFKKSKVKITQSNLSKRDAYTKSLIQLFSVNFEKNYENDYSARLPLK